LEKMMRTYRAYFGGWLAFCLPLLYVFVRQVGWSDIDPRAFFSISFVGMLVPCGIIALRERASWGYKHYIIGGSSACAFLFSVVVLSYSFAADTTREELSLFAQSLVMGAVSGVFLGALYRRFGGRLPLTD
jgi:hypothetical protein